VSHPGWPGPNVELPVQAEKHIAQHQRMLRAQREHGRHEDIIRDRQGAHILRRRPPEVSPGGMAARGVLMPLSSMLSPGTVCAAAANPA
jgi:hypothetical protein